jgi:hypothetical protein
MVCAFMLMDNPPARIKAKIAKPARNLFFITYLPGDPAHVGVQMLMNPNRGGFLRNKAQQMQGQIGKDSKTDNSFDFSEKGGSSNEDYRAAPRSIGQPQPSWCFSATSSAGVPPSGARGAKTAGQKYESPDSQSGPGSRNAGRHPQDQHNPVSQLLIIRLLQQSPISCG